MRWMVSGILVPLVSASLVWGQTAPPPTCDEQLAALSGQVKTSYQSLAKVPEFGFPATLTDPSQQLAAMVRKVWTVRTQYDIEESQVKLYKQQLAEYVEALRQAREELATLKPPTLPSN